MELDESTKLILLPEGCFSFECISLSLNDSSKSILVANDHLFELREVHGSSQYDVRPEPTLPSGGAVKSIIVEGKELSPGAVLKSPSIINCTPFNIVFYILGAMHQRKDIYTSRYQTLDDILDNLDLSSSHSTLRRKTSDALALICDSIQENGEEFYKYSTDKSFEFLESKTRKLQRHLLDSPDYAITGLIKASLSILGEEPAAEILDLQTTKYCVDMIFGSYLSEKLKEEFLKHRNIDFSLLDASIKEQESKRRALAAVQDNMEAVVLSTKQAKNNTKNTKTKTTKKPVKKVAVGKGALDSFFKRP